MSEKKQLTLGSLFDGSGGFPLGGILAGIKPIWASEIEPFPIRVTTKRIPQMKHYGDVSVLSGAELEPVDIITFGSPCFPEGTLILTSEGYIPIEEVEVGMKVLTHNGRWKNVTATGAKFGETVILKGNHYGLECTPNHPIYSSGERKCYPQLGNGRRGNRLCLESDKYWIPAGEMDGKLWAVPNTAESLPITSPVYSGTWREKTMPPLSDDLFYFIGRWLGDGWIRDSQRPGRPEGQRFGAILLCDSLDKEDELRRTVEKVTDHYSVERGRSAVKFKFTSHILCEWLTDNFGRYAYGKTMPGWVFGLPDPYRQALLDGLIDSDGSIVKGKISTWRITTVSKRLAESIRLLAEIQGYSTTVFRTEAAKTGTIEGRTITQRESYEVKITKSAKKIHLSDECHGWYRVRSVTPTHRTKIVYNLTVEDDNSYVADGIVVHNCQDLSIAGKRAGIHDGERSNLFFQAVRIVKEMREATNGKYPRYIVWENVPGALSSNGGDDFRAVLEAIINIKEEGVQVPAPEKGKWPKADVYLGDGWSVAYRIFDTQHWQCPQRRARVYLVGDLAGERAGEILFKSEELSGYSAKGFAAWQKIARYPGEGAEAPGREGSGLCVNVQGRSGVSVTEGTTETLIANDHGNHPAVLAAGFCTEHSAQAGGIGYEDEVAPTLKAGNVPATIALEHHPTDSRIRLDESGTMQTLCRRMGSGGGNVPMVLEPAPAFGISKEARGAGEKAGYAFSVDEEMAPTLVAKAPHGVAVPFGISSFESNAMKSGNPEAGIYEAVTSRTLDLNGGHPGANQGGIAIVEKVYMVEGNESHDVAAPVYQASKNSHLTKFTDDGVADTLVASEYKDPPVVSAEPYYIVRRLTPVECARLQAFPDWWCDDLGTENPTDEEIEFWKDVFETHRKVVTHTQKPKTEKQIRKWLKDPYLDSAVYRMYGNGISLPIVWFILSAIVYQDGLDSNTAQ